MKHGSLQALKELGSLAFSVLPRLKLLLEKRKNDGDADFREVEALEFAIFTVSGKTGAFNVPANPNIPLEKMGRLRYK